MHFLYNRNQGVEPSICQYNAVSFYHNSVALVNLTIEYVKTTRNGNAKIFS